MGESPAAGVTLEDIRDSVSYRFIEHLADLSGRHIQWQIHARSGICMADLNRDFSSRLTHTPCDVLLLVMGVNDAAQLTPVSAFRKQLSLLIRRFKTYTSPGAVLLIAGAPMLDHFPALPWPLRAVLGRHSRRLDNVMAETADQHGLIYVPTNIDGGEIFADDGFHPNTEASGLWAELLAQALHQHALVVSVD